jgi:hypothetical protein
MIFSQKMVELINIFIFINAFFWLVFKINGFLKKHTYFRWIDDKVEKIKDFFMRDFDFFFFCVFVYCLILKVILMSVKFF